MTSGPVEQRIARAVAQFNAGQRDDALQSCRDALEDAPHHAGLHHLMALLLLDAGQAAQALGHAEQSLAAEPAQPKALATALRAALACDATAKALDLAARASAAVPDSVDLACQHAALLTDSGQPQQARERLQTLVNWALPHASAWFEYGRACRAAGDLAAARAAFEAATQADAALVPAWFALSLVRQDLHDIDGAAQALERVLSLAPAHVEAAVNLGLVRQSRGQLDAALASYAVAYAAEPASLGRIAHALASQPCGALWIRREALCDALSRARTAPPAA